MISFIALISSTRNFVTRGNHSATSNRHTLQFSATHTSVLSLLQSPIAVSWLRILTQRLLTVSLNHALQILLYYSIHKVFTSQSDFQHSPELVATPSQSSSTAVSRDPLNSNIAGFISSLCRVKSDLPENAVSIVIAQQYFHCCLRIRCRGKLFTESLPSNERLL
jgi:hypothetical protein